MVKTTATGWNLQSNLLLPCQHMALGVPLAWIASHRLVLCDRSDADGDSMPDRREFLAGTNPNDPDSSLRIL
ncbi:MAG: hypothetical protein M2R45_01444 [Verrucomicrobia subdivision 3 bacterium]|nr:hypothetical protein [Limisphaerales bacterium]MCS1417611.1 hypothetical protein [Limisphaerales bacterium]